MKKRGRRSCNLIQGLKIFFILSAAIVFDLSPLSFDFSFSQEAKQQQTQPPQQQPQQKSLEEERLLIIKADIQKEIEINEKLKKELEEAHKTLDENARERLVKVSKIYEAMPAEEAAKRLDKLDEDTVVDILSVLKPRSAGGILSQMDNDKAASISKKMITRSKPAQEKTSR
ncbi:MAG: hypothetical protein HQL08_09240 [Nitrospirae bacterium]|nr:hypothetical protein [Nitrospirota bacterium]